jgi:hypothetical protein
MPVLSIWTPLGGVLGVIAPLGLAASAGTALVVDLDQRGPRYPGDQSLARLATEGPRRADLSPPRKGVAVLRNGGIDPSECQGLIRALCDGWPAVVLRPGATGPTLRALLEAGEPGPSRWIRAWRSVWDHPWT